MKDAFGRPQTLLVLGGTSDIAEATATALVAEGCRRVALAARDVDEAGRVADRLRAAGATDAHVLAFEAGDPSGHEQVVADAVDLLGDLDVVVSAFAVLGRQDDYDADPAAAFAAATVNYAGAVSSGLAVARRLRAQGHGTLVCISSVAGQRVRADSAVYGSSKAGMDAFAQGLGDRLQGSGASVMVVRPGFVTTSMTEGMDPQPFATDAESVAAAVVEGLHDGAEVVWSPGILRWVFMVLRHLPRPIWRRVAARA